MFVHRRWENVSSGVPNVHAHTHHLTSDKDEVATHFLSLCVFRRLSLLGLPDASLS